jgi:hypothetical protein
MGQSHSADLRERIVPCREFSRVIPDGMPAAFGLSESCAVKLLQRVERTGFDRARASRSVTGRGKLSPNRDLLIARFVEKPDITNIPQLQRTKSKPEGNSFRLVALPE